MCFLWSMVLASLLKTLNPLSLWHMACLGVSLLSSISASPSGSKLPKEHPFKTDGYCGRSEIDDR